MSSELRAVLSGVGLWAPGLPDFQSWVDAGMTKLEDGAEPERPPAELLHPRLRRRTSTLTRAAVTVAEAAAAEAGVGLDRSRFVLVSSYGEIQTTVDILAQLAEPEGPVSPTAFHNSVHNTATGYLSIATGNHRGATALAAGPHGLEAGLLDVFAGLGGAQIGGGEPELSVLIFAEELLPQPFARADADPTCAIALAFARDAGASAPESKALEARLLELGGDGGGEAGELHRSMLAPILPLLRRVADLRAGRPAGDPLALLAGRDPGVDRRWALDLRPIP